MLNKLLALTALSAASVAEAKISPEMKANLENIQRDGIKADSSMGRHLISKARRLDQAGGEYDMSFVADYSIKFMGCHHVTQWASAEEIEQNGNQNEDEAMTTLNAANGRIRSKGLVRFRLCPSDSCFDHFNQGCSSNYGEYVVDMYQFLEVYVAWQMESAAANCATYRNTCYTQCYESSNAYCYSKCYAKYGVDASLCQNNQQANGNEGFDLETYIGCAEYAIENADGEEIASYLGPYCASQGGEVRLGFFMDETCSIASSQQAAYYTKMTGIEVPYTTTSLVSTNCISCQATANEENAQQNQDYYNYNANGDKNYYVATAVSDMCGTLYMQSGKCESNMDSNVLPYPEEGACVYIDSVKALKNDGIIRSDQRASSKPASIAIGIFSAMAVLMAGYVVYLKGKISKSRVNLAGATASLA